MDARLAKSFEALADTRSLALTGTAPGACTARATLGGRAVILAATDPALDSGALGAAEAALFQAGIDEARLRGAALVLRLDSAGARLTEGVPVLGAFRRLQGSLSAAVQAGVPVAAVLGRHCFGGASLLACSARVRFYGRDTLFGLSGPRALGGLAGLRLMPEAVQAIYGTEARLRRDPGGVLLDAVELHAALCAWRCDPGEPPDAARRQAALLRGLPRLRACDEPLDMQPVPEALECRLDGLFPGGWDGALADGVVAGEGWTGDAHVAFAGFVGGEPVDAHGAWRLARVLLHAGGASRPRTLVLLLDSPGQATGLDDERLLPCMEVAQVCAAAARLRAAGRRLVLWLVGEAGGAIYVALAALADEVVGLPSTRLQTLPARAVSGVIGGSAGTPADPGACLAAGVVDRWVHHPQEVALS